MDSERNRPAELQNEASNVPPTPEIEAVVQEYRQAAETGMPPRQITEHVFSAIRAERLYILTHPELSSYVWQRMEDILAQMP